MKKLLKLQIRNIFHNKLFYICLGLTLLTEPIMEFAMTLHSKNIESIRVFPQIVSFLSSEVGIISLIFIALFCSFDFNEGTTKNIIARGYTRTQFLYSKYIASLFGLLIMYIITISLIFILFIRNGLGFESTMIYQLINSLFFIITYTILYATMSVILEKNGAAIIACMFAPNIISLLLGLADSHFKINISKFWLDNVFIKFTTNPTLSNLTNSIVFCIIYTIVFILLGNKILKNKEIK